MTHSDGISYVEDASSERSLDITLLALFLVVIPIPLLIIAFIAVIGVAVTGSGYLTFFVYLSIGILSWIAAPGIWKLKRFAFYLVLIGLILAIIASSTSFFAYITTGIWNPGQETIYWFGIGEIAVYIFGIIILLCNKRKFFEFKKNHW